MSTVNFSVPEKVKREFNKAFKGENKSAVLASLMQQAIADRERRNRRAAAAEALLKMHGRSRHASDATIRKARVKGRP